MKNLYFNIGIALLLLILSQPLLSADTLLFVGDDDFPPYSYKENGRLVGIDIEIIEEMASRMTLDITIKLVPWQRLIIMTKNGQCDGSFSLFHTREREKYALYAFSQPIHVSRFPLFYKTDKSIQFNTIEDLYGKTIGINRGFSISREFDQAVKQGKIRVNIENEVDENIFLTANGRIDGFTNNYDVTKYKIKHVERLAPYKNMIHHTQKSISDLRNAYVVLSKNATAIKNKEQMIHQINQTLMEMKQDGFYLKLHHRYLE